MNWTIHEYTNRIADYIDAEYDGASTKLGMLTDDEKYTIRNMIHLHHECEDSVNNTANYIMSYLVESRQFMKDIKENE